MKIINAFPGYTFVNFGKDGKPHNMYRDTDIGFGGYIISNPGIYTNVALLDIASLHPNSIRAMNCFGEYTKNFTDLVDARVAIKHKDFDTARKMLNGRLAPYLKDETAAKELSQALKIAINSCYGLTAANFDNPLRDTRNKNNIVALRGALFMRTLQDEVEGRGFKIVAIKTDSIKIADANKAIVDFCVDFAKRYGYTFEHECTYDRMCQINDADYIAKYKDADWCQKTYGYVPGENAENPGKWTATGAQFAVPYVFKSLFSKELIELEDTFETKEVKTALYLDVNEDLPDVTLYETIRDLRRSEKNKGNLSKKEFKLISDHSHISDEELDEMIAAGHNYHFVGRVGQFCPIKPGCGGGELLREGKDNQGNTKYTSATGAKGYRWMEAETVKLLGKEDDIDYTYHRSLVDAAVEAISAYGDFEWFVSDNTEPKAEIVAEIDLPWKMECGKDTCIGCPHFTNDQFDVDCKLGHDVSDVAHMLSQQNKERIEI